MVVLFAIKGQSKNQYFFTKYGNTVGCVRHLHLSHKNKVQ